jgi:hypothetical protein
MTIKRGWAVGDEKGPDAFFEGANFVEALGEAEKLYPRQFIRETFYDTDTGDLMVAATPLDLGVSSAAVAYTEPNEVAIGP